MCAGEVKKVDLLQKVIHNAAERRNENDILNSVTKSVITYGVYTRNIIVPW